MATLAPYDGQTYPEGYRFLNLSAGKLAMPERRPWLAAAF